MIFLNWIFCFEIAICLIFLKNNVFNSSNILLVYWDDN